MTILMRDAYSLLGSEVKSAYKRGALRDVLFADDTLIVQVCTWRNTWLQYSVVAPSIV